MKTLRTIVRAFFLGAIAGLLIAPRSGRETREMLSDRWNALLDSASGMEFTDPTTATGAGSAPSQTNL